jgi:hypothetical protein
VAQVIRATMPKLGLVEPGTLLRALWITEQRRAVNHFSGTHRVQEGRRPSGNVFLDGPSLHSATNVERQ